VKFRVPYFPEAGVADEICDDLLGAQQGPCWGRIFHRFLRDEDPMEKAGSLM